MTGEPKASQSPSEASKTRYDATTGKLRTAAEFVPNQQVVGDYREVSCARTSSYYRCRGWRLKIVGLLKVSYFDLCL
jgi:hypothetical protein